MASVSMTYAIFISEIAGLCFFGGLESLDDLEGLENLEHKFLEFLGYLGHLEKSRAS